jgi:hypothetical protein
MIRFIIHTVMRTIRDLPIEYAWELALSDAMARGETYGRPANLAGANLAGADLTRANLTRASLAGADLTRASLADANLTRADLADANLIGANLADANLIGANLVGANLVGANLAGTCLADANLIGANLVGTCLDPVAMPSGTGGGWQSADAGWVRGWRTERSTMCGAQEYLPGHEYVAPWFSVSNTECHPGLYLWPTLEQAHTWGTEHGSLNLVEVKARPEDIHRAGDKWRCRQFVVVGVCRVY